MSPPWVFLNRYVQFKDREESAGVAGKAAATICGSREASEEEVLAAALKPSLLITDPPERTHLDMLRIVPKFLMQGIDSGTVSSTDKGLVVLYTGTYRPGDGESGCYLVFDASTSSISTIPQLDPPMSRPQHPVLPPTFSIRCLGTSAAILRLRHGDDGGAYVLAELVTSFYPGLPDAHLYLWRSASSATANPDGAQWMRTSARLPLPDELCGPTSFHIDMAFAFGDSCVCWADLLSGILICDLFAPEGPKFTFVPLPKECCLYTREKDRLAIKAEEFCSLGCVCGAIKCVALVGYSEGQPKGELVLKTWTLSSDLKEWKEGPGVLVRDLRESESFRKMKLPKCGWPINPVLSMNEDEIIYISICDMEFVQAYDFYGQYTGRQLKLYGHYVLGLDLLRNKVLYFQKSPTKRLSLLWPNFLASDFTTYLDGGKHSQRGEDPMFLELRKELLTEEEATEEEATEVGTMVKRTRTKY